jgi:hypothetical protein
LTPKYHIFAALKAEIRKKENLRLTKMWAPFVDLTYGQQDIT